MAQMTMIQAITDALRTELRNDENVLVFGEDVGVNGGVFRATEGLQKEFGEDRVFDTPLAESGIGGIAIGLDFKDSVRYRKFNSLVSYYEVMDSIADRWLVCVTVQVAVTMHQSQFVPLSVVEFTLQKCMRTALKV